MAPPSGGVPPYAVALADVLAVDRGGHGEVRWHRLVEERMASIISTSDGTRAHVEIDLRSVWARAERGVLVLLLDLLLAGFFWMLGTAAERGFARWIRVRAAHWIYTYHSRLTLALFAFFVIPAIAFAVWSYQRLRSDDLQTREVLVRETLHAVLAANEYQQLPRAARRSTLRSFVFEWIAGRTSDSLLDVLAPIGLPLPPAVQLSLGSAGELSRHGKQAGNGQDAFWLQRCAWSGAGNVTYWRRPRERRPGARSPAS